MAALVRIIFSLNEVCECPETDFELSVKEAILAAQLRMNFDPLDEGYIFIPSLGLSFNLVCLNSFFIKVY